MTLRPVTLCPSGNILPLVSFPAFLLHLILVKMLLMAGQGPAAPLRDLPQTRMAMTTWVAE